MLKKCVSLMLIPTIFMTFSVGEVQARGLTNDEAQRAEQVRAEIAKLGIGPDARIKLKLLDNRKVEGYVSEAGAGSFVVTNPKSGVVTTVAYPRVSTAKGNNLSGGARIAISVGISIALSILIYKYGRRRRRGIF